MHTSTYASVEKTEVSLHTDLFPALWLIDYSGIVILNDSRMEN